jgi:putative ABC transport system permease protein
MLVGERTKFLGIVFGMTFAALLMSQQMAIFCGIMMLTTNQIRNIEGIDIWVMDRDVSSIDDVKPLAETALHRVWSVPGVRWAVPFYKGVPPLRLTVSPGVAKWQRRHPTPTPPSTSTSSKSKATILQPVMLFGLDNPRLFRSLQPESVVAGSLDRLHQSDAIFLDKYSCDLLWPDEREDVKKTQDYGRFVGRTCELFDHRAEVVGVCRTVPNFVTLPVVYTTFMRAKQFMPGGPKATSFVLVKAEEDVPLRELCQRIKDQTGLKALSSEDFSWGTIWYYITRTGIPFNFGITVVLGFLVGTAIAGQTFYQFTTENLRQFGALKAMGTSNRTILGMILLQALIVAPIGYGLGVGLAALFGELTKDDPTFAFFMPWQVLALTGAAVLVISVLSSLLSIRRVLVLEPAVVFR